MARYNVSMPTTLGMFETKFIENPDAFSPQEASLILRVFAVARHGSPLFFIELEKAVEHLAKNASNQAFIEMLVSATLMRDYCSERLFSKLAESAENRAKNFTKSQLIQVVRLIEFNQVDAQECKQRFFELTRNPEQLSKISKEDLLIALETLNYLGASSDVLVGRLNSVDATENSPAKKRDPSCEKAMTLLSVLADPLIHLQLKQDTVKSTLKQIEKAIPAFDSTQIPNMLQGLVRLDEEWDREAYSKQQFLALFGPAISSIVHHLKISKDYLSDEQRLFAANFLAKFCREDWQAASLELTKAAPSGHTANNNAN